MSNRIRMGLAVLGLGVAAALPALTLAASASEAIPKAVADPARPEADRARDADRKPAEVIDLIGMHPGGKVAEMLPGQGYFTRIFSKIVGPQGVVYAWMNVPASVPAGGRDPAAAIRALAADANYPNIKLANLDPATPLPEKVDLVWTSLNYHDLHNRPNADLTVQNKMVWDALKPGGLYMVIDHAAESGSGARDSKALHRIDPELVKTEVSSVGFKLVTDSKVLQHSADDHTKPSGEVARGQTDQFVFIFQKPAT
ncbi:MAG: methyltransferase [Steroidobacteraceae bacterium]